MRKTIMISARPHTCIFLINYFDTLKSTLAMKKHHKNTPQQFFYVTNTFNVYFVATSWSSHSRPVGIKSSQMAYSAMKWSTGVDKPVKTRHARSPLHSWLFQGNRQPPFQILRGIACYSYTCKLWRHVPKLQN